MSQTDQAATPHDRQLVLVAGAGRSGTSLMTGILAKLGMSVPQPEIIADETNPHGFGEPKWVVDFHTRLMRTERVTNLDGRTNATELAAKAAADADVGALLRSWLEVQFVGVSQVVIKDPRIVWFLPLWQECAAELGISTGVVTMLRYPSEVIASARTSYGDWQTNPSRACGWVNVMLETERMTRALPRAYVRYPDLLAGWRPEIRRVGAVLDIPSLVSFDDAAAASIDEFLDPGLHRQTVGWDDMEVPQRVRDLCQQVWDGFGGLAQPDGESDAARAQLDGWRQDYAGLYSEAEQIAQSTIRAAEKRAGKAAAAKKAAPARKPAAAKAATRKAQPRKPTRRRKSSVARRAYRRVARLLR